VIQIELVAQPLDDPILVITFVWVLAYSLGRQRNKVWYVVSPLKQNIEQ
jgi:hypothetical protein